MKKFKQFVTELDTSRMPRIPDSDISDRRSGHDSSKSNKDWMDATISAANKANDDIRSGKFDQGGWSTNKKIQNQSDSPVTPDIKVPNKTQTSATAPKAEPTPMPKAEPAPAPKAEPAPAPKAEKKKSDGYLTSVRPNDALPADELRKPKKNYSNAELDDMFKESVVGRVVKALNELKLSNEKPAYSDIEDKRGETVNVKKNDSWSGSSSQPSRTLSKGEILGYNNTSNDDKSEVEDLTKKR